jgi:hypothetical protein
MHFSLHVPQAQLLGHGRVCVDGPLKRQVALVLPPRNAKHVSQPLVTVCEYRIHSSMRPLIAEIHSMYCWRQNFNNVPTDNPSTVLTWGLGHAADTLLAIFPLDVGPLLTISDVTAAHSLPDQSSSGADTPADMLAVDAVPLYRFLCNFETSNISKMTH